MIFDIPLGVINLADGRHRVKRESGETYGLG